jgi:hypothetical protein
VKNHLEKSWSESQLGRMTFPGYIIYYGKKVMFQTTNQMGYGRYKRS